MKILKTFAIVLGVFFGSYALAQAATIFKSQQVGSTPVNGYYLKTDGTNSTWATVSGGGGSGTVSTSTNETAGSLSYWTSNSATPALLGKVATTSATCSGSTSCSAFTVIGSSPITISSTGVGSGLATTSPVSGGNVLTYSAIGAGSAYGTATSTLTASGPLTGSFTQIGSGGSLGCTTASAGVAGCLNSSDWSTFNNKQNALTVTWPQILTGSALTFGGLSTSTSAVIGNIPYFSGVNTFANIATTTLSSGTGITISGGNGYLIGGSNSTVGLASMSAGVLGTSVAGVPSSQATSTLYGGSSTGGFVLGWSNALNGLTLMATSSAGGGSGTVNSGTTNQIAYYTGSTAVSSSGFVTNSDSFGALGIGTTTPKFLLQLASSTAPQLQLGDGSLTSSGWFLRNNASTLFIGTTSPTTFATSTNSILSITNAGKVNFGNSAALQFDQDTGSTTANTLITGNIKTDINPGVFSAFDIAQNSGCSNGTVQTGQFGFPSVSATNTLSIFGLCNGNGAIGNFRVGIGTSSPIASLSVVGTTTGISSDGSWVTLFTDIAQVFQMAFSDVGHLYFGGTAPTLSSCGTSPSIVGTDNSGTVTVGSVSASGCTITFAKTWATAPNCVVTNQSMSVVNALSYTISTTAITVTQTGLTGALLNYSCSGTKSIKY